MRTESITQRPPLQPLQIVSEIAGNPLFSPSGATGAIDCDLFVAARNWGTIVRVSADGVPDSQTTQFPGYRQNMQLQSWDKNHVLAVSHDPELFGIVDTRQLSIDSLPIPIHAWGGRMVGPVVATGENSYAFSPIGDRDQPRKTPRPWIDASLVEIVDSTGHVWNKFGAVEQDNGAYISWLMSSVSLGVVADTIKVLSYRNATISSFVLNRIEKTTRLASEIQLPRYFKSPAPQEVIRTWPWIQFGGDWRVLSHAPQVIAAAFSPDGKLIAVRSYGASRNREGWLRRPNMKWISDDRGLEVYGADGRLIGAYNIPPGGIAWLQVDDHGRLFIGDTLSHINVVSHPAWTANSCPVLPVKISITTADTPPANSYRRASSDHQ